MSDARPRETAGLVDETKLGIGASFDTLVEQHRQSLYTTAYRWFEDPETALDCVQETLLRAYQSLSRFRGECAFSTWLFRILEKVCLEEQRRQARWVRNAGLADLAHDLGMEERLAAREDMYAALEAFAQLPLNLRTASLLNLVEGHSHAETSAILGITVAAAKMRVKRARVLMSSIASPAERGVVGGALSLAYRMIGGMLLEQGKMEESDQALLSAIRWAPETAYHVWQEYWARSGTPVQQAALEQAVRVLAQASEWPHPAGARVALANLCQWRLGDRAQAERYYKAHLQEKGFVGECARGHLAWLYAFNGKPRRAASQLSNMLLRTDPDDQNAVLLLARCLALCREPATARWAARAEEVALGGWRYTDDTRVCQLQTANMRALAADTYRILGDRVASSKMWLAARQALPEGFPIESLQLLR